MAQDNPAFLWYPRDWLTDTQVQQASFATQGVWMNLLCRMHLSPTRGVLIGTLEGLSRLISVNPDELKALFNELKALNIAIQSLQSWANQKHLCFEYHGQ